MGCLKTCGLQPNKVPWEMWGRLQDGRPTEVPQAPLTTGSPGPAPSLCAVVDYCVRKGRAPLAADDPASISTVLGSPHSLPAPRPSYLGDFQHLHGLLLELLSNSPATTKSEVLQGVGEEGEGVRSRSPCVHLTMVLDTAPAPPGDPECTRIFHAVPIRASVIGGLAGLSWVARASFPNPT